MQWKAYTLSSVSLITGLELLSTVLTGCCLTLTELVFYSKTALLSKIHS